jgi:hypothetical protein
MLEKKKLILDLGNTLVVEVQKGILLYSCHIVRKFLNIDTEHNKYTTKSKCGGETPVMLISTALLLDSNIRIMYVLLRAKKVGHQISVSFEKFDVVQALLSFFLTLFQLTV